MSWGVRASADRPGQSNLLRDVACPSPTTCVAVGASDPSPDNHQDEESLIQTLSGGSWVVATSPDRAAYDNHLWGVSCSSETQCVATGYSQSETIARPLIHTLSGGVWRQTTPAPYRGGTFNYLYGLSCPTRQCVAVGDYLHASSGIFRTGVMTNHP